MSANDPKRTRERHLAERLFYHPCFAARLGGRETQGGVTPPTPRWLARGNSGRRNCRWQRQCIQESLRPPSRRWNRILDRNECQCVAALSRPHPRRSLTGECDLLAPETRLVADHAPGATLAFQAVAHGDAHRLALDRKVKLPAAAGGASDGHGGRTPRLSIWAECRRNFRTKHCPLSGVKRTSRRQAVRSANYPERTP